MEGVQKMSKVIASLVVATVMLVGSSALATVPSITGGVLHFQDFGTTMLNGVTLNNGQQTATSSNWATVQNNQNSLGDCGLFACEDQTAFFSQVGNADGYCALVDLDQSVLALGTQQQTIGEGVGAKHETQNLTVNGSQVASKGDGGGTVTGDQIMTLSQDQHAGNASGPMNESSVVFGAQHTNVSGAPGATGAAGSSLLVMTTQEQLVY
jgi:hypothetical protein